MGEGQDVLGVDIVDDVTKVGTVRVWLRSARIRNRWTSVGFIDEREWLAALPIGHSSDIPMSRSFDSKLQVRPGRNYYGIVLFPSAVHCGRHTKRCQQLDHHK